MANSETHIRRDGRPIKPAPSKRRKAPRKVTAANKAQWMKNLEKARAAKEAKRARGESEHYRISNSELWERIQKANILEFAEMLGYSFEGRPGQELTLRLLHGMPLPSGTVKTFVRVPCDGFVLEEKEMSWQAYYRLLTGSKTDYIVPKTEPTEMLLCVGRRSGKTTLTAIEGLYQTTRDKWLQYLRKSEKMALAGIIATTVDQARDLLQKTCVESIKDSPLRHYVDGDVKRHLLLANGLAIRSFPCNARAPRGYPYFFTVYDEAAWFYVEGKKAGDQIDAAVDDGRMQFPGSKHMEITTPAGKQGRFYEMFAQEDPPPGTIRIKAATWLFRPELHRNNPDFIPAKFQKQPFHAGREIGAEFDEVVEPFLPEKETLECLNLAGDMPPDSRHFYGAGIDASGLSGNDRFGFGIAGRDLERGRYYAAVVRSYEDRNPNPIMAQVKRYCRLYDIHEVWTDQYAKGWVHAALRSIGIEPKVCPSASIIWTNFRKFIMGRQMDMPQTHGLKQALLRTQSSYGKTNHLTIIHPRDRYGHADEAEGLVRAVYGVSQEANYDSALAYSDPYAEALAQREEEAYDPLTYGRA